MLAQNSHAGTKKTKLAMLNDVSVKNYDIKLWWDESGWNEVEPPEHYKNS